MVLWCDPDPCGRHGWCVWCPAPGGGEPLWTETFSWLHEKTRDFVGRRFLLAQLDDFIERFPEGGYFVLGCEFDTPSEIRIVADAGPLGYRSIAAHGLRKGAARMS